MSKPETLANLLLRETYRPRTPLALITPRPMADIRAALTNARRFVLDDAMAAFLADLSTVPFQVADVRRPGVLDALRYGARLPHPQTWVEFSGHAFRRRLMEIAESKTDVFDQPLAPPEDVPRRWGWLLEEHPQLPQAVRLTEFCELTTGIVANLPFHWVWQTTDEPLPWRASTIPESEISTGIIGYHCPQIGVVYDKPTPSERLTRVTHEGDPTVYQTDRLLVEMGGAVRYALAFLSTLNDVPIRVSPSTEQARGFVARGSYRRYLDHTTITLTVPARQDPRRLASKVVALARRRAHDVRGHWRLYQRGGGTLCQPGTHEWGPAVDNHARCAHCSAWRTWINPHVRGDASLGYVVHNYAVTHGAEQSSMT